MPRGVFVHRRTAIADRFWAKVEKMPDGCWVWQAARSVSGYGLLAPSGGVRGDRRAHRVSWELHNGPIPAGLWVLHSCDNPPCVNPDHLFLGTRSDNMRDCASKGRLNTQVGTGRWTAKA
jgi:hypothetical protein